MVKCSECGMLNSDSKALCAQCKAALPLAGRRDEPSAYGESPISVSGWLGILVLSAIPIVGLIMLCVWAWGSQSSETKRNFAKATLILMVIGIVIGSFRLMLW